LNNLGNVYRDQGKYGEAEEFLKRALVTRERALGANHPDVASTLNNLAIVYRRQGKYSEAEGLYKRALAINEQALGTSHPNVAWTLNDMAVRYEGRGESGSALAYSRKATAAILAHRAAESTGTPRTEAVGGLVEPRASYFQRHVANLAIAGTQGNYRRVSELAIRHPQHWPASRSLREQVDRTGISLSFFHYQRRQLWRLASLDSDGSIRRWTCWRATRAKTASRSVASRPFWRISR